MADMPENGRRPRRDKQGPGSQALGLDLARREEEILKFWEENKIFEKTLAKTKRGKRFVFYEGPPTANGSPGIHHFEARAFKDLIPRYKTMRGFYVERKAGWDTHGLPVEIQVEKELGLKSRKDIERYGIAKFNETCRESVWRYKEEFHRFTKRMGFWLDLEHPYITYEASYIETLWRIIKEFRKKKLFYQDFKVVPWCTRCGTALSTHELGLGYRTVKDRSVYARFRIKATARRWENTAILSWTTTPWTLPGNVALAVNAKERYVAIPDPEIKGQWLILGERPFRELVEKQLFPAEYRRSIVLDDIDAFSGRELVGLEYEPLFPVRELMSPKAHRVYPADFVTMEEGTGVVHTAVMYGEDDYRLGTATGLPKFHTVSESGHFVKGVPEGLGGGYVKAGETEENIISSLKRRGLLFAEEAYEHEYPFCWRCDTPLLYYARQAWWVNVSAVRRELVANNEKVNWVPEYLKRGRFGGFLKEARDWAFSRERYWGTPIPVWVCGECGREEVIGSYEELDRLAKKSGNRYWALRHGQAETQLLGIADDDKNTFHLTPRGKKEAEAAAMAIKKIKPDFIVSSPMLRARETAEIVAKATGAKMLFDDRLWEIRIGDLDHKPVAEYHRQFSSTLEKFSKKSAGGESLTDLRTRLWELMRELEAKHRNKRILLVSHEYPIWILDSLGRGLSDEITAKEHDERGGSGKFIKTGGVMEISFRALPRDRTGALNPHRPFVDDLELACPKCEKAMRRIPEVADVWFDSGAMPFAQHRYPFAFAHGNRKENAKNQMPNDLPYPADFICEGLDQTRGWFYTLLAVSTLLGRGNSYRNVISVGLVLDKNGQKMSKSKGNVVDPFKMMAAYGTDAIRWYFYTINAPGDPKRFDEQDVLLRLRGALSTLWNSFVFFDTYVDTIPAPRAGSEEHALDRWVAARRDELTAEVTRRLDAYDVVGAARLLDQFIVEDLSNWYIRRSRRRLQRPVDEREYGAAARTVGETILQICELMAPFTPFLAEIIYRGLRAKLGLAEESIHLREWPRAAGAKRSAALRKGMAEVRRIAALALAERAKASIKVRQPLAALKIRNPDSAIRNERGLAAVLCEEVNVKAVAIDPKIAAEIELDTAVTAELREEGLVREFVRNIQEMRRDGGFKPRQKIRVQASGDQEFEAAIERWRAFVRRETGATAVHIGGKRAFDIEREATLDGRRIWMGIRRA